VQPTDKANVKKQLKEKEMSGIKQNIMQSTIAKLNASL
jgi:hypothetical protein